MYTNPRTILCAAALLGLAGGFAVLASNTRHAPAAKQSSAAPSAEERDALIAKGKAIFVEKCAKCHNERGDKELSSGKPLSERGMGMEAIAKTVKGRLGKGTEEERQAVTLYIASFMKGADKGESKP